MPKDYNLDVGTGFPIRHRIFKSGNKNPSRNEESQKCTKRIRTETPRSVAQRGTTEPTITATVISANLYYLCTDLINYAISQVTGMQILDSTDQNELSFPKKGRMIFIEDPRHFGMNMNKRLLLQMINLSCNYTMRFIGYDSIETR